MRTLAMTLALPLLSACGAATVGGDESPCGQAVDHLTSCGVTNMPDYGECDAAKQQLAQAILAKPCADFGDRSTFGFWGDLLSNFFGSGGPGDDDEGDSWFGGGGGWFGGDSDDDEYSKKPNGATCHWNSDCASGRCGSGLFSWLSHTCQPADPDPAYDDSLTDPCADCPYGNCPYYCD